MKGTRSGPVSTPNRKREYPANLVNTGIQCLDFAGFPLSLVRRSTVCRGARLDLTSRHALAATALAPDYETPLASSTAEGMTALRHRRPNLSRRWEQSVAKHRMGTSKISSVIGSRLPTCLDVAMIARHPSCRSVGVTTRLGGLLPIRADVDVHPGLRGGAFGTLSRQSGGGLWGWMGSVASHCAGFSIRSAPLVVIHLSA